MNEIEKAQANLDLLTPTQWCVIYSFIHKQCYGEVPINYRKQEFMNSLGRKKVRKLPLKMTYGPIKWWYLYSTYKQYK